MINSLGFQNCLIIESWMWRDFFISNLAWKINFWVFFLLLFLIFVVVHPQNVFVSSEGPLVQRLPALEKRDRTLICLERYLFELYSGQTRVHVKVTLHESKAFDLEDGWDPNPRSTCVGPADTGRQQSYFIISWISLKPRWNRHTSRWTPKCVASRLPLKLNSNLICDICSLIR